MQKHNAGYEIILSHPQKICYHSFQRFLYKYRKDFREGNNSNNTVNCARL